MADFTFTASSVLSAAKVFKTAIAYEAISAGQFIYLDSTNSNKARLSDADASASADVVGQAMNSCATGQPVSYIEAGSVTVNGVFTGAGQVLVLSGTAGKCCLASDLGANDFVTMIGISTASTAFTLDIDATGIQYDPPS